VGFLLGLGLGLGLGFPSIAQNYGRVLATKRLTHCVSYERTIKAAKLNEKSQKSKEFDSLTSQASLHLENCHRTTDC